MVFEFILMSMHTVLTSLNNETWFTDGQHPNSKTEDEMN